MGKIGSAVGALFNTFGSRAIGFVVSTAATFAAKKFGVVVDASGLAALEVGLYSVIHSVIDHVSAQQPSQPAAAPSK